MPWVVIATLCCRVDFIGNFSQTSPIQDCEQLLILILTTIHKPGLPANSQPGCCSPASQHVQSTCHGGAVACAELGIACRRWAWDPCCIHCCWQECGCGQGGQCSCCQSA